MKKLLSVLLALAVSAASFSATLSPVQLLNPAGSTSGQAIVSTGASTAPAWSSIDSGVLNFVPSGTGATPRSVQNKLRDTVSVKDYGSLGSPADDSTAFQNAVNALPAAGGTILVPDGTYVINTVPTWGTKSIMWDIGLGTTFSGAGTGFGKFPYMSTNGGQMAVGPWIQSQSSQAGGSAANGGIGAFNVEMLQPSTYNGQSVAIYAGARGSSPTGNVWAINPLIQADVGAGGTYQNIEVDVNNFSSSALVKGISINGIGTVNPAVALEVIRTGTGAGASWVKGIDVRDSITGIDINAGAGKLQTGISIGAATGGLQAGVQSQQLFNSADTYYGIRNTDTSPAGSFLRFTDAANTKNIFRVDTSGNITGTAANFSGPLTVTTPDAATAVTILNNKTTNTTAGNPPGLKIGVAAGTEAGWTLNPAAGDFVAVYPYISSSAVRNRVWAMNPIVDIPSGSPATAWAYEGNINVGTANTPDPRNTNHAIGADMVSGGTFAPSAAFATNSTTLANRWKHGLWFDNIGGQTGSALIKTNSNVSVDTGLDLGSATVNYQGIRVGNTPSAQVAPIGVRQFANNQVGIFLQRFTDTAPTGNILQVTNAANSAVLASIDASGNYQGAGANFSGALTGGATTVSSIINNGVISNNAVNAAIEHGALGSVNTPFIDFHSSGNNNDYDARIIASGGTTNGTGTLTVNAASTVINGTTTVSGTLSTSQDASAGVDLYMLENLSTASNTTKTAGILFKGRDTVNASKSSGEIVSQPLDGNYVAASLVLKARAADALATAATLTTTSAVFPGSVSHATQEIDLSYTYNQPTTGQTVTLASGTQTAIIDPAGTLAALTVTLPTCDSGYNGSLVRFSSSQAVTVLTVNATSGTVVGGPTSLALGSGSGYLCRGSSTTWHRLY